MREKIILLALIALQFFFSSLSNAQTLRLGGAQFSDGGVEATSSIDVTQDICNPTDENNDGVIDTFVPEIFSDSIVTIKVYNRGLTSVYVNAISISVPRATSDRKTLRSKWLAPISDPTVPPGSSGTSIQFLIFDAESGKKRVPGKQQNFADNLGFRNVTISLRGVTAQGSKFNLSTRHALSFDNFDRCG